MLWLLALLPLAVLGEREEFRLARGEEKAFKSDNYPEDAPAKYDKTWAFTTDPGLKIRIFCDDFRLFELSPCGDYVVVFNDGGSEKEVCGVHFGETFHFDSTKVEVTLKTGNWARGFLSCKAKALAEGDEEKEKEEEKEREEEKEEEGERPQTEPSWRPANVDDPWTFFEVGSEEVDSAEHGGPAGRKGTTCSCGLANKDAKRVFGGRETKVNEFPFVAGLGEKGSGRMFCGSSIITAYHALTAAHCTYRAGHEFELILAEHDINTGEETQATQIVPVKKIIEHENYNPGNLWNDIALAVLESRLEFNQYISPVCMPTGPLTLDGQYIKIIGWGRTEKTSPWMSHVMRKVDLRVLPKSVCHSLHKGLIPKGSPSQTCVYGHKKSACSGDSGGPLVWVDPETNRYTQIGLVSYGTEECGGKPRVSTDVTHFIDWVRLKVQESNPEGILCTKI